MLRAVDYKNLGAEELGSIYESLLELHPQINQDAGTFELGTAAGHERKTTGSYYTPTSLINCLLDSALDPVVDEAAKKPTADEAEQAILDLKVCDPACGSGHFLIAAAHRIGKRLAAVRTGDEEPAPDALRHAVRDVIGHCIFGVDINPMAVELCKINLWLESLEPGKPLSFLDHHIQCGNSLLGATPALLAKGIPDEAFKPIEGDDKAVCREMKRLNRDERRGQKTFDFEGRGKPWERMGDLATSLAQLDQSNDGTVADVRGKQERYENLVKSSGYLFGRLWADAWCAAFVWKKTKGLDYGITQEVFRQIERNPHGIAPWMRDEIQRLAEEYQFFHWHLALPQVFRVPSDGKKPENEQTGWDGGFDVVLGNPPWDKVKFQEREWFAASHTDISDAETATARRQLIAKLETDQPEVFEEYLAAVRTAEATTHFFSASGKYPLGAVGDLNTYPLFTETALRTIGDSGRVGIIVKTGIISDYTMRHFFAAFVKTSSLVSAFDFSNKRLIFPAVVANERFTLLTFTAPDGQVEAAKVSILNESVEDLREEQRTWTLSPQDAARINPNTFTCPLFQQRSDAELVKCIYRSHPVLIRGNNDDELNPWNVTYNRVFDMTNDSGLFVDQEALESQIGSALSGSVSVPEGDYQAVLEGKLFDLFHHRHGTFDGVPRSKRFGRKAEPNHFDESQLNDPSFPNIPRYWLSRQESERRYVERLGFVPSGVLAFRDVCRTHTDSRTVRATVCPAYPAGNKAPLLLFPGRKRKQHAVASAMLCSNLTCYIFDYVARQKFSGGSLNKYILVQLPVIEPEKVEHLFADKRWVLSRVLELTYAAWDLEAFASDCGYDGPPFRWDEKRRFLLRCELDAAYCHLYLGAPQQWQQGSPELLTVFPTPRDAVEYIMETFPIVKRKDEQQHGEYRTKRVILEIYDAMQKAIDAGQPYQTLLDPPPGPPPEGLPDWQPNQPKPATWPPHIHPPRHASVATAPAASPSPTSARPPRNS